MTEAISQNEDAYNFLTLSCTDSAFKWVESARGDARLAWKTLVRRCDKKEEEDVVKLLREFQNFKMKTEDHPEDYIMELEFMNEKIAAATNGETRKSEQELKAHIVSNVPKEYNTVVTTTDGQLHKISLEELGTKLRMTYDRLVENRDIEENGDKKTLALTVKDNKKFTPRTPGRFKGTCRKCGKYGHKAADCRGNNNNSRPNRQPGGEQGSNSEKLCYRCQKVGHIAKDCPNKNKQTGMFVGHVATDEGIPRENTRKQEAEATKVETRPRRIELTWADWDEEIEAEEKRDRLAMNKTQERTVDMVHAITETESEVLADKQEQPFRRQMLYVRVPK